jgi:hypothetical protein
MRHKVSMIAKDMVRDFMDYFLLGWNLPEIAKLI